MMAEENEERDSGAASLPKADIAILVDRGGGAGRIKRNEMDEESKDWSKKSTSRHRDIKTSRHRDIET
jgi:hypothetical protein